MDSDAEKLVKHLLEVEAVKLNPEDPFTWASGLRSPIYCDNRISLSYPEIREHIKYMFVKLCNTLEDFDAISGVATAGIPHGAILADALGKPFSYVRSKAKAHGRQNKIEGRINSGDKVILVEDLVSTGKSSLAAANALKENGVEIIAIVAIFNYGFDLAKKNFKNADIPLYTLSNYSELINQANHSGYITTQQQAILNDWNKDPQNWFKKNFK